MGDVFCLAHFDDCARCLAWDFARNLAGVGHAESCAVDPIGAVYADALPGDESA